MLKNRWEVCLVGGVLGGRWEMDSQNRWEVWPPKWVGG